MHYDIIVIGAGLSGLSAASLLAKSGLKVAVIEHSDSPGGSCGIFSRNNALFDQGAAMLYGFGDHSFNAHRFLFNCLEEPIVMTKHELLYTVEYNGKKIRFGNDVNQFIHELSSVFPSHSKEIKHFYKDMQKLYHHVILEAPSYTTADCTNPKEALRNVMKHPLSYMRFLSYMNISAEKLLRKYFKDSELYGFFDKLTSTYCYATVQEAPAVMASVMFIDNHEGGSFYPAGSTLFLPGHLEKVIEEHDGDIYYNTTVTKILFHNHKACGVAYTNPEIENRINSSPDNTYENCNPILTADQVIYSGTVWNLYNKLLPASELTEPMLSWANAQLPTYSSLVYYALVKSSVIPSDTCPITMLASTGGINESEITVYIMSLDDHTLCPQGYHTVVAIGPSFVNWNKKNRQHYQEQKQAETERISLIMEDYFPGFINAIENEELASPLTIESYTMKNNGAVAGPKQMLGQHMLKRQSIRTNWDGLYCCCESTTMGTGTPTVTTSGIAVANEILKLRNLSPYVYEPDRKNYVEILPPPVHEHWLSQYYPEEQAKVMELALCFVRNYNQYQKLPHSAELYSLIREWLVGISMVQNGSWRIYLINKYQQMIILIFQSYRKLPTSYHNINLINKISTAECLIAFFPS